MAMSVDILGAGNDYEDVRLREGVLSWCMRGVSGVLFHYVTTYSRPLASCWRRWEDRGYMPEKPEPTSAL